ncbi:MAG: PEP-CTERM sorting domain-containing protein [Verrucomicrobiota bacterium]
MKGCSPILAYLVVTSSLPGVAIDWINPVDGDWETTTNWSTGTVPTNVDDVTISQEVALTVSIDSGAQAGTLTAQNDLVLNSGSLSLFGDSAINGSFSTGSLTDLIVDAGIVTFSGTTSFDQADVFVRNGGQLFAPNVASYVNTTAFVANRLEATGDGSFLDLSSMITMTGGTAASVVTRVTASSGGSIDLFNLNTVANGRVSFTADGIGSQIDLSNFQSLNHTGNTNSGLHATNGGSILLPLAGIDLVTTNITLDSTSTLDVDGIVNYNGGTATFDGNTGIFSSLVNADGTGFRALNGAFVDLSTLTDYNSGTAFLNTNIEANGTSSTILMDQVMTITGNTAASTRGRFQAFDGGLVDLSGLQIIDGGSTRFTADGIGSRIDLSNVNSMVNTGNVGGLIQATNGGEISFGQNNITVQFFDLEYDGTGIVDLAAFSEWLDGGLNIDGTSVNLSTFLNINGSSLSAINGGSISVPSISSYNGFTGFVNTTINADGTGSAIDLSTVTTMTGNTAASTRLNISATNGGIVDLGGVTTINPSKTSITANGTGSAVNLASLSTMEHGGNLTSFIEATDNGQILFGTASPTLTNVDLRVSSGGLISTTGTINLDGGALSGNGTILGNVAIINGSLEPGDFAGILGVSGNLTVDANTTYAWQLLNLTDNNQDGQPGIDWDQVFGQNIVFQTFSIISLDFVDVADPDSGNTFWNSAHSWDVAFATQSLQDNGLFILNPNYLQGDFSLLADSNTLQLVFTPVPEPSTYALFALGGGLIGFWFWRRRSK